MSSAVNNLGTFDPNQYKANGSNDGSKQRMAGDYLQDFANANANDKKDVKNTFSYTGNNGKNYGTNTEKMLFGNSQPSQPSQPSQNSSKSVMTTENTVGKDSSHLDKTSAPSNNSSNTTGYQNTRSGPQGRLKYHPEDFKYYRSAFGSGNGASAYRKDMEKYNEFAEKHGDNSGLNLVTQMMHPDWGASQRAGGGAEDVDYVDYSKPSEMQAMQIARAKRKF